MWWLANDEASLVIDIENAELTDFRLSTHPSHAPARVIHIVENLDKGAVENWLVRMLRVAHMRGQKLDWTFYCALGQSGRLDDVAKSYGAKIVYSPVPIGKKLAFIRALRAELRRGKYDVLHGHHDLISGLYLIAAMGLPIKRRIVHIHNADESVLSPSRMKKAVFRPILRQIGLTCADQIIGISNHTLDTYLSGRSRSGQRHKVHYYGIDSAPFTSVEIDRAEFRRQLNLPDGSRLLLFAGRIVPEKNPLFAVDVFAALKKRDHRVFAIFAGAGSLESDVLRRATELGVADSIRMLGFRSDVAQIMKACDWFILPRPEQPKEGLGIAVVEAQLAGLRLLLSHGIADDPLLPFGCYERLALSAGPHAWADAAMRLLDQTPCATDEAAARLAQTPFDLQTAFDELVSFHE